MFNIPTDIFIATVIILTIMVVSIKFRKLTVAAAVTGGLIGISIFLGSGYTGMLMLGTFFIAGTLATACKKDDKLAVNSLEPLDTRRKAGQVFANGGVAGILAALVFITPAYEDLYIIMLAASLASATADTLSSELGMIYGKRFYNVISWKKEQKGLDGAISLEGTLIGILGAAIIAIIYSFSYGYSIYIFIIILAGTIGNLADSILGATLERKKYIGNDVVNFLNTLLAALVAGAISLFI